MDRRIFIVEPDPGSRGLLAALFREEGDSTVAVDAPPDLEQLREARPQVLLTEWRFGGLPLSDFLRRLRADRELARLPVVVWTAADIRALPGDLERDFAPLAVVAKPHVLPELLDALEAILRRGDAPR